MVMLPLVARRVLWLALQLVPLVVVVRPVDKLVVPPEKVIHDVMITDDQ